MTAIEWGWAGRALDVVSGDRHVVVPFPGGALVGLVDGLGHGPEAADASLAVAPLLEAHANEPVLSLVLRCHERLRKTRGAVMSLASFSSLASSMTWIGVGNVAGVLLRSRATPEQPHQSIPMRPGVVGFQLPPLRGETLGVVARDILILATDGIRDGFTTDLGMDSSAQEIAESILARFGKDTDDAHVVVARYIGEVA